MPKEDKAPVIAGRPTIHPYRHAAAQIRSRLAWDLRLESWRSRSKLKKQRNQHRGKKGVILCNGPSLNDVDFDLLKSAQNDVVVIGLNKVNLLFERTALRPDLIVCMNRYPLEQNAEFYNSTEIPLYLSTDGLKSVPSRKNIAYLHSSSQRKFARDVSFSINVGYTVTFTAMQIAFHLGILDLALVGCDHSFSTKGPSNMAVESGKKDESHFDPRYFSGGMKWQLPDLAASEYHYSMAREVYSESGGQITNCTEGGELEIFQRQSLDAWLAS